MRRGEGLYRERAFIKSGGRTSIYYSQFNLQLGVRALLRESSLIVMLNRVFIYSNSYLQWRSELFHFNVAATWRVPTLVDIVIY